MGNVFILVLFLLTGILAGGAVSAYRQGSKFWTVIAAIVAAMLGVLAVVWMLGETGSV